MSPTYLFGRLCFEVEGQTSFCRHVTDELAPIFLEAQKAQNDPAIVFSFKPELEPSSDGVMMKPVEVYDDGYLMAAGGMRYRVRVSGKPWRVEIQESRRTGRKAGFPDSVHAALDWNYLTYAETLSKNFMYEVFDYLTQVQNLRLAQTYVHASAFEKGAQCVGVFAWGGIGKTTSMLKMVLEDGWRFLSDDLGLLSSDGMFHRSPKKMQIYGYNLLGEKETERIFLSRLTGLDRATWVLRNHLRGPNNVRRRISAEELFGHEKVAKSACLTTAIFAERVTHERFMFRRISAEELGLRASAVLMRELEPFSTILAALQGAGRPNLLPSFEEIRSHTASVVTAAVAGKEIQLWQIPASASPTDVFSSLKGFLDANSSSCSAAPD